MNISQSSIQILDKIIKGLTFSIILYPLQRIQSIKQIQTTYSNISISNHKSITSLSIHHGLKSYFRGLMSFITKSSILTLSSKASQFAFYNKKLDQNMKRIIFLGFATVGYVLTYPLQIVNIRMSTQIQSQRFYSTIKECFSKIKKNQGLRTIYRAFPLSYSIFTAQMLSIQYILHKYQQNNTSITELQKILTIFGMLNLTQIILYPLISLKKIIQINGAIGHSDNNYNLSMTIKKNNFKYLWRGSQFKIINILLYSLLNCYYFGDS